MKIDDIKEQKIMSTEIKKLNRITYLLYSVVTLLVFMIAIQGIAIYNLQKLGSANLTKHDISQLEQDVENVKKAVHFRYFNITNSLQDIHNVKIETHHGHVQK